MLTETQKTYYVLVVEGQEVTRSENKDIVDLAKSQLSLEKQELAEVKQLAENGKQVLWG